MMNDIRVIYRTFLLQLSQSFSRATFRFCIIFQPIIYTFVFYMMYHDSKVEHYMNYVILGSGICSLWSSICFSSAGDIERERYAGTLECLFSTPTRFYIIYLGKMMANTILGLSGLIFSIICSQFLFHENLVIKNPLYFCLSFLLLLIAFISISSFIAPIFTLSKNARTLMNCMEAPIFILCGFVVPIQMLPSFIRPVSYLLTPTLAIQLIRNSANGITNAQSFFRDTFLLLGLCLLYFYISILLFRKVDHETRVTNRLGGF